MALEDDMPSSPTSIPSGAKQDAYRKYLLVLLALILACNFMDRWALGLVLQNIKADLSLSDTQLGFLTGLSFALFYSLMGIPLALWADRGDRRIVISLTTALWTVAVAACALAGSFVQLLLIRVAVAVGEAGCMPTGHSLLADHFARDERPRAVSIYMLGGPFSVVLGYCAAGWLNEFYGWRAMFVILALPGLILAPLARFTLREPRRENLLASARDPVMSASPQLVHVCSMLWRSRTFRHLLLCYCVVSFFASGIAQWQPTFFIRSYGLKTGELGNWFTLIYGAGAMLGTYLGGMLAVRYASGNERLQLNAAGWVYACFGLISVFIYWSSNEYIAFGLLALSAIGGATITAPLFALIQTLVPANTRALSVALIYLFSNLIGLGLGPLLAGAISDALQSWAGNESLRYALLALCPGYLWGAWHLWRASHTVLQDIQPGLHPAYDA